MANARPPITLRQERYTVREVAFLLNVEPRTVREYMKQTSVQRPGQKLLVATKPTTIWYIARDDLVNFMKEKYDNA